MKWFKHDADANMDAKLQDVLLEYGAEGYGVYWYCIELIASNVTSEKLNFELEHDARVIARHMGLGVQRVEEMMRHMVTLGLFESSGGVITCMKLAKRADEYTTKTLAVTGGTNANEGYVYFISGKASGDIKIGFSKNPWARLKSLQTANSKSLKLLAKIGATQECETWLHNHFKDQRKNGEWFGRNEKLLAAIELIDSGDAEDFSAVSVFLETLDAAGGAAMVATSSNDDVATIDKNRLDKNRLDNNNTSSTPAKPKFTDWDMQFAQWALNTLKADNPNLKKPNLDTWAKDCRLMRERDNRDPEQMKKLWQWARANSFWQANILSIGKFRDKFDQLFAQSQRPIAVAGNSFRSAHEKREEAADEVYDIDRATNF
ncbi:MAG: GIY-YIG nuclease family protein [Cellvibrionaceae bacterium]